MTTDYALSDFISFVKANTIYSVFTIDSEGESRRCREGFYCVPSDWDKRGSTLKAYAYKEFLDRFRLRGCEWRLEEERRLNPELLSPKA